MSDDLASILNSIRKTQGNIINRLVTLEQQQQTQAAADLSTPTSWGRSSPTSPPTKRLAVLHGRCWQYDPTTFHNTFSQAWQDFTLELSISAFTDAYYYRAVTPFLMTSYPLPDMFMTEEEQGIGWGEFETFEECQANYEKKFYDSDVTPFFSSYAVFPLCAIAVRNNGTTGSTGQYLPITLTDRQQSSFIQRDLRPWMSIVRMSSH